jgi:hypothetical protein
VRFLASEQSQEYRVHFAPGGGEPVAVTITSEAIGISSPASPTVVREFLARHGRVAAVSDLPVALTLTPRVASVAVALADAHVERSGGAGGSPDGGASVAAIRSRMPRAGARPGGLAQAFADLGLEGRQAEDDEVERTLAELERAGLAARVDRGWCPRGDLLAVALATLPVAGSIGYDALVMEAGRPSVVDVGVIVAGPGGTLLARRNRNGSVRLEGTGLAGVTALLQDLVAKGGRETPGPETTPSSPPDRPWDDDGSGPSTIPRLNLAALRAMEAGGRQEREPVTGIRAGPGSKGPLVFCGACGARIRDGARFCGKCGGAAP